jgi:biotin operon repressor
MTESQKLARIFKALSVDTRVRMVHLLKRRALCVGALSAQLNITQGAVSQHLRILEKRGYYVHYRLNEKTLLKWKSAIDRFLGKKNETGIYDKPENIKQNGARQCVRERRVAKSQRS